VKLEVGAFGSAAGIGVAAAFTICALFVALAPQPTAAFIGYLLHIDISGITRPVTWASYFAGVVSVGIWTGLWAAVVAKLYNFRFHGERCHGRS
jgi:2TM family of unknown function (DUF5676)